MSSQSPWSVDQLLALDARGQLDDLLDFYGDSFDGPNRRGLLTAVREACKRKSSWGFALANALIASASWQSDLWPALITGLREADLPVASWSELLTLASNPELIAARSHDVANLLYGLVKDGGEPFALDLVDQANAIALQVWQVLENIPQDEAVNDWLTLAPNRPAGVIVQFWVHGLSLRLRGKTGAERVLPENYRQWFMRVLQDETQNGGMGRSLLASQTAFLFNLDEAWTSQQIIPLFNSPDKLRFIQAWGGFLRWGRMYQGLSEALLPFFVSALPRFPAEPEGERRRFIEFYVLLAVFFTSDPREQLLPTLFHDGSLEDRIAFASQIGSILRRMQPDAKYQLWESWLRRYWQDRLVGVPAALDEREVQKMLEWIPYLGELFPAAALLATRGPEIRIERSYLTYELRKSERVIRYQTETAELLIYLCNCSVDYHMAHVREVANRLQELPDELRIRLDEALAQAGYD